MYYLPTSCLVFFFFFSLFHPLPYASSKKEHGKCEAQFRCGNITAGFPFSGGDRHKHCGHPFLELQCFQNITSLTISDHLYHVLHIDQTSNTLRLIRTDVLDSVCTSPFTNATLPPEVFDLSPNYKSVTFYNCYPDHPYLLSNPCPKTPGHPKSCQNSFTVNVPKRFDPEEKELNWTNLGSVLREGFEVNVKIDVKACQECSSTYGFCGFNKSSPLEVKCRPLYQPTAHGRACYLPTSCMFLFFLFSFFHHISCASNENEQEWCQVQFQCGNITAGFPFSGGIRPKICGHPFLELHYFNNRTSLIISNHLYNALHIDKKKSNSLRLARAELQVTVCNATYTATTLPPKIFGLSANYKSLTVFYLYEPKLRYSSSYTCLGKGPCLSLSKP